LHTAASEPSKLKVKVIITNPFPFFPECIPEELKRDPRWVCCNRRKVPYVALVGEKETASSADPVTWRSYSEALEAFYAGRYAGIGRVIVTGEGFIGIDLDGVRNPDTGRIDDDARRLLSRLDSYCEVSPSGRGVKVWVRGGLPISYVKPGLEVYTRGRYFTVTGQMLPQYPATIEERTGTLTEIVAEEFPRPESRRCYSGPYSGPRLDLDQVLETGSVNVLAEISDASADRKYRILCPWIEEHTAAPETGTVVGQYPSGATFFHCWHSHCRHRRWRDFINYLRWFSSWRSSLPDYTGGSSEVSGIG